MKIERRFEPSRMVKMAATVVSLLLALGAIAVLFGALRVNPLVAYREIFRGAFGSWYGLSETVTKTIPLLLVGVGLVLAYRAQVWNIGAEGQLLMGAIAATGVALRFQNLPAMFLAGFVAGALWALIPAALKVWSRVDEVLTSLMLVYVAAEAVNYLIYGPWKGAESRGFPLTDEFVEAAQLPVIGWSRVHYPTLVIALMAAGLVFVLIRYTTIGFEIRATGENQAAARYAGMSYGKTVLLVMGLSGGLAGIAGVGEVAGIHHRLLNPAGISPGYGFSGIIVAWLARLNPLGAIVSAFLLAGLLVGGDAIQVSLGLPAATTEIFNGVILLFVVGGEVMTRYRIRWS
jgi:general nucleoside transport system permease protein